MTVTPPRYNVLKHTKIVVAIMCDKLVVLHGHSDLCGLHKLHQLGSFIESVVSWPSHRFGVQNPKCDVALGVPCSLLVSAKVNDLFQYFFNDLVLCSAKAQS